MRTRWAAALFALIVTGTAGSASALAGDLQEGDLRFLREAAGGGLAEVALGKLAMDHAQSADVHAFGQRMMEDHGKVNAQVLSLAHTKQVELPTEVPADAKQVAEQLAGLSGAAFDRAFMKGMVADHEKAIGAFEAEAKSGGDKDLRQFAAQTLPMLRDHLALARRIQAALKGVSSL
jgi:putative membrane protein